MSKKEVSPFTPGNPVPIDLFVGRKTQIRELIRYIKQSISGKQENIFLSGERGIGKSSLASFLRYYVSTKENILGVHAFLGGVSSLEEMVRRIFDQLLKTTKDQPSFEKISSLFGKYIKEVGLFGMSVSFNPQGKDLQNLVRNFPETINKLVDKVKDQKAAFLIVLDDINGLVEQADFAHWYKSFVDEVATHFRDFPVSIILIGLPEKRDVLAKYQPSLMRIFRVINIEKLNNREVEQFFKKAFSEVEIEVDADAMSYMVSYSGGLPLLMHEIGDAIFWLNKDDKIDEKDAVYGIIDAAEKIGKKYLDPKVYRAIRSDRYRSILRKLGEHPLGECFKKKDMESKLNVNEKRVFNNFLQRMKKLDVIQTDIEEGVGSYRFVNKMYPLYILMESGKLKSSRF